MFKLDPIKNMNEEERLKYMNLLLKSQLSSEEDSLANISNATAIIMVCVDRLNWAGFYILRGEQLVLGPFQGLPACNRIDVGKGVCGTAVKTRKVQLVPDVHKFPGHIACDSASNSELVIPIINEDKIYGVLDLDSPEKNRFTQLEKEYFIKFVDILNEYIDWEII
ncbi:GAF domain-containing protein [Keratinibaculum paraultunense]|uniref:GAF domain-containing protein n=1 Tax=Keratinibaculum paraultunense TaxID=1278232 RepID=A0A4R3KY11_9FIRM|nr:GAF domain-containing protein [Keratinibaculum paraultunense]QQY79003.1 GAF domain-containing protein [Keratinibaculum paraultunense]TCS90625.1 GAF domain-containing protein [Keratinibaculum paraultunense]